MVERKRVVEMERLDNWRSSLAVGQLWVQEMVVILWQENPDQVQILQTFSLQSGSR